MRLPTRSRASALALAGTILSTIPTMATAQGAAPRAAAAATARGATMQLSTNRGRLITLSRPMTDLFVANPEIADVQVRSPTQLYVFGKKPGETTVSATARDGAVVFASTVRVGNNFDSLGQMLTLAMPESNVTATPMEGLVLLTGTVRGPEDAAEAEKLVQAYVGEGTRVLSRLRNATPLQVNLQVRFAEVNRSFLKNIGNNLITGDATSGFKFGIGQGRAFSPQFNPGGPLGVGVTAGATGTTIITKGTDANTIGLAGKLLGVDVLSAIDVGEQSGQVTTLANPNLTALSGETGTFLAGGEIPIPIAQALGTITIEYKQFGVSLAYTPTVLGNGQISLRVRPEVSQLDYNNAVTLNSTRVPALTTRRAETTVELGSGQSFMIAGLLQNTHNNTFDKTPGIADVPVLGALFKSNAFQRNETELVIIITPYLVKPANPGEIQLPTDGYKAPNDLQRVLLGTMADGTSGAVRPQPTLAPSTVPAPRPSFGAAAAPIAPPPAAPAATVLPRNPPAAVPAPAVPAKATGKAPTPGFSF